MQGFKNITRYPLIITAVIAAVVGVCGGVTGQIFSSAYLNPVTYGPDDLTNEAVPELRPVKRFIGIEQDFQVAQTLDAIEPSLATIYLKKAGDTAPAYAAKDFRGSGVIITADGWIMTAAAAVNGLKADQVSVIESGSTHGVEKVVVDSFTQSAFIKIKANNLPVADFGDSRDMRPGQLVIIPYQDGRVAVPVLVATHVASGEVNSSDRFSYAWELQSPTDDSMIGAVVANLVGETVGIVTSQEANTIEVRPINQLRFAISEALRASTVVYSGSGISYIDLSFAPLRDSEAYKRFKGGALVTTVAKGSAAEKAGVKVGDVITAVNEDLVDADHTLSDLLLSIKPATTVPLTIVRGQETISASVVLGSQK